jgi:hypothetical protein
MENLNLRLRLLKQKKKISIKKEIESKEDRFFDTEDPIDIFEIFR